MIGSRFVSVPASSRRKAASLRPVPAVAGRLQISQTFEHSILIQLMLAMGFVAIALILYLAQASQQSVLEFSITDLQSQKTQLNMQHAALSAEAAGLQTYSRIETVAIGQLHMVRPAGAPSVQISAEAPRVPAAPPPDVSVASAQRASQPLDWVKSAVSIVKSWL